ncbi:MAG: tRNA preQ1(34) S-adenosylmethionine ribosyltransferase-isomerase QueA [Thermodesulfobacteriota bacterium]|nr:tRNA preQ1(34) S-adenosylmethionine ribosyltransferase-isomerase QueA [Thermodesulfobacteriota bacterium]
MRIEEFDYNLPKSLIAQYPSPQRGESSLMVLRRNPGIIEHREFKDVPDYLQPGDLLLMNNTRVLPARLIGNKETGGKIEILVIPSHNGTTGEWEVLIRNAGKVKSGTRIQFGEALYGELTEVKGGKGKIFFSDQRPIEDLLQRFGHIPLPPYIKREDEPLDRDRYQTVIAERDGSIASPTAGLHFTQSMLQSLIEKGVNIAFITLHVGPGTFTPVKVRDIGDHLMGEEWVEISKEVAREIEETREQGKRVIAVGTTTTRALESFADEEGRIKSGKGSSNLFIHPPYGFRVIDGLITNFHLPKSTLIMLVSAFAGREFILKAYQEAVERKYRFYSYGDAMLIL